MQKTLLFIHPNIPGKDAFIQSINTDKVNCIELKNTSDLIAHYNKKYNRIGFVWHNVNFNIPFGQNKSSMYSYFKQELIDFLTLCNNNIKSSSLDVIFKNTVTVDLITCNLNNRVFINDVSMLSYELPKVIINYSLDNTGSVDKSNWIMESNNTSIKDLYFNNKINNYYHTLGSNRQFNAVITKDYNLYTCGDTSFGALGLDMINDINEPTFKRITNWYDPAKTEIYNVPETKDVCKHRVTAVAFGSQHCAVIRDGCLYVAGYNLGNGSSLLGLNDTVSINIKTFTRVTTGLPQDKEVIQVACGIGFTFVIMCDGTLYSCGSNRGGSLALGLGDDVIVSKFTKVILPVGCTAVNIACGDHFVLLVCNNGQHNVVYGSGDNSSGQLGLNDLVNRSLFTLIPISESHDLTTVPSVILHQIGVVAVYCSGSSGYVLIMKSLYGLCKTGFNGGNLYSAGYNFNGELGNGSSGINQLTYKIANCRLPCDDSIIGCAAGPSSVGVILKDGTLYFSGTDFYGKFGLGLPPQIKPIEGSTVINSHQGFQPVTLLAGKKVLALSIGNYNANILVVDICKGDTAVYSSGTNTGGVLGQGIMNYSFVTTVFLPVTFAADHVTCSKFEVISLYDYNYIFLVDMKLKDCGDYICTTRSKNEVCIISNYQNYDIVIKNKRTKYIVECRKFINILDMHQFFKKNCDYEIKVVNGFTGLTVYRFTLHIE